ncbi:hypothetical protein AFL94_03520 [Arthrobacter sp. LS16]|nr:hypothetical protein AFL94_03520 [Arthrobacter sp. LS16]
MRVFRRFLVWLAALLTLLGAAASVIMFLQPWRSCPEIDDSSAGCPATERDLALLGLAVAAMLIGLVLWIAVIPRYQRITGEFAAPFGALPAPPAPGAPPVSSDRESTDKEQ